LFLLNIAPGGIKMRKSQLTQFFLTLFFGPVGLFYSSTPAALGFVIAAIGLAAITYGVALLFVWPVVIVVGFVTVGMHNSKIDIAEQRHKELLAATRNAESNG
jgi:hypothetical protein